MSYSAKTTETKQNHGVILLRSQKPNRIKKLLLAPVFKLADN